MTFVSIAFWCTFTYTVSMKTNQTDPTEIASLQNIFVMSADEAREFIFESEVRQMEDEANAFVENDAILFFS